MKRFTAVFLTVIIVASVSVMFLPDKWATSIPEVGSCFLAALWMVLFAGGRSRARFSPVLIVPGVFVCVGLVQLLTGTTVYRWDTWLAVLYWTGNLAVLFAALQTLAHSAERTMFLRALSVFGFIVAVIASLQALSTDAVVYWLFPTKYTGWVVMGPFVYHNQYAAFIELLLPPALYLAMTDRVWRWLYLLIAAAMYASVFISGSRAGLIFTTAEMLVFVILAVRRGSLKSGRFYGAGALLAAMVTLLAFSAGPDYLVNRFRIKDPYSIRREFLFSSLEMFKAHPIEGVGLGNWATSYPAFALFDDGSYANQAHNDWAQWSVEGGAPLLIVMFAMACWIVPRSLRSGWGCGVAAVFLHCFVDYPIQRPAVALVFFSLLATLPAGKIASAKTTGMKSAARLAVPELTS